MNKKEKEFIYQLVKLIDNIDDNSYEKSFIKEWINKNYPTNDKTEIVPKIVGKLTKPFGLKGYHRAEIGHTVYEENDRYVIYLIHDTLPKQRVTFYKESFGSLG